MFFSIDGNWWCPCCSWESDLWAFLFNHGCILQWEEWRWIDRISHVDQACGTLNRKVTSKEMIWEGLETYVMDMSLDLRLWQSCSLTVVQVSQMRSEKMTGQAARAVKRIISIPFERIACLMSNVLVKLLSITSQMWSKNCFVTPFLASASFLMSAGSWRVSALKLG